MRNPFPLLFLILLGCSDNTSKARVKTLDFGFFTMETPISWTKINLQGIDSYIGAIIIDRADTLQFDLGPFANTLTEERPPIIDSSTLRYMTKPFDTSYYIIVKDHRNVDEDKYKKQNISWDTIDGYVTKIIQPMRSGQGITGIYIDSLWIERADIQRFNLYGKNLTPKNEKTFLQAVRTLKFKRQK